jgi:hypothetical protein
VNAPNGITHAATFPAIKTRSVRLVVSAAHGTGSPVAIRDLSVIAPALDLDAVWPTLWLAAGGWNSAKVRVRNNGPLPATVNLAASVPLPITAVLSPTSVTVAPGLYADVTISLSGATATFGGSTLTVTAAGAAPETVALLHTDNLALNAAGNNVSGSLPLAFASSVEAGYVYPPGLVNDGDTASPGNYWVSNHEDLATSPQHIGIDFGNSITVRRVVMTPRLNFGPRDYSVETSTNNSTWTKVAEVSNAPNGAPFPMTFNPVSVRFLRLRITRGHDPRPGYVQVRELAVYRN